MAGIAGVRPEILGPTTPQEFRVKVRRPDDHLVFDLIFENLQVDSAGAPRLVRKNQNAPAYVIVEFPPQSFGEQAFLEVSNADANAGKEVSSDPDYPKKNVPTSGETVPALPSARIRMAGRSRVVVSMPDLETELPYSLAGVLKALRTWPMRLNINAAPDQEPRPGIRETLTFDRAWLTAVARSQAWTDMQKNLGKALAELGAPGAEREILASAKKLGDSSASMLARNVKNPAPVLQKSMQGELDRLSRRFPQLARGEGRNVAIAALSLASTKALVSSRSRFEIELDAVDRIPYLPILLSPHDPPGNVTALELPYRLIITPLAPARWLHSDEPVEHAGRTELWHTRLTTANDDHGRDEASKIRAIWSPDYPFSDDEIFTILNPPAPFRMSLDPLDRKMLVKLMAGFAEKTADQKKFVPRASSAKRLHLTSLGALLDSEGNWKPRPKGVDLEQWVHQATTGRDHYVRVVYAGYLCPFGHAASLIKVTERKFESLGGNSAKRVAVLRQRFFIVVREHVRQYAGKDHEFRGNNFPFTKIEVLTKVTPNLLEPGVGQSELKKVGTEAVYGGQVVKRMVFWPIVQTQNASTDFEFEIAATDISGRRVTFSMPLLFVGEVANDIRIGPIKEAYNDKSTASRRRAELGNTTVCYAPFDPADKGDPRLPTSTMTFRAGNLKGVHYPLAPNYYPETEAAQVGIKPVQKLLGSNAVAEVTYPQVYKEHRFGELDASKNPGKVFLQLINQAHNLEFGEGSSQAKSDALGALASPQMAIQGLSKIMGPVAAKVPSNPSDPAQIEDALKNVIGNKFDPTDFFKGAKILGGVDLADILTVVNTLVGGDVPKMLSRELPDRVEATFDWETEIKKSDPLGLIIPRADQTKPQTRLKMRGVMITPLKNPKDTNYEATASLDNFKVNLFGFVIIWFEDLKFVAKKGQKPDVTVNLRQGDDAIQFGGPLEFVNELRNLIPSNGFSDPPNISVTPSGIAASYSLNLPAVGVGIFTLSGVSLGAGFNLPFDSKPASVKFNFSERQSPFSLTVSMLGGGGFFAIGISSRGVQEIEAALEFGAAVAINLGVASGGVEIKAGVYFHWLEPVPDKGSIDLAGYVRLHGELSVLGLISASLTFNLQLAYHKESGKSIVWGEATLVIEVEVLFFSADVSVRCRREFAGSESDPKFKDLIPDQNTWSEYCGAFAAEAA